jgi:hypothetical protein
MKRETLLRAVEVLAAEPDDDKHVSQLRSAGFSAAEAEVLAEVLPEAFAIPILEELGVASVSDIASAKTRRGRWVKVVLSENPIFAAALSLAREHRASGVMANITEPSQNGRP